jgi:hypothetical protein
MRGRPLETKEIKDPKGQGVRRNIYMLNKIIENYNQIVLKAWEKPGEMGDDIQSEGS